MKQTVVGLFNKSEEAQQAVQQLMSKGFKDSNVDLSIGKTGENTTTSNKDFALDASEEKGGVSKFFKNLFGDDNDRNVSSHSNAASRGTSIVTVHADSADEAEKAADILDQYGAINVDEDAEDNGNYDTISNTLQPGMNTTTGTFDTADKVDSASSDITGKTSIPIIEEELQVGKRTVETGGARLRSRIVTRPVEENVRLKEERVYINRNPVNRTATSADFDAFKEGEIELREHAEVPVVSKEARIVEEVSLGKETNERSETIRDTVRKTEVDVENIEGITAGSSSAINKKTEDNN